MTENAPMLLIELINAVNELLEAEENIEAARILRVTEKKRQELAGNKKQAEIRCAYAARRFLAVHPVRVAKGKDHVEHVLSTVKNKVKGVKKTTDLADRVEDKQKRAKAEEASRVQRLSATRQLFRTFKIPIPEGLAVSTRTIKKRVAIRQIREATPKRKSPIHPK